MELVGRGQLPFLLGGGVAQQPAYALPLAQLLEVSHVYISSKVLYMTAYYCSAVSME